MTPRFKLKPANMELRGFFFFSHDSSRTREKKNRKNSHTVRFVKRAVIEAAAKLRGKREREIRSLAEIKPRLLLSFAMFEKKKKKKEIRLNTE